jgi:hypothetical protein
MDIQNSIDSAKSATGRFFRKLLLSLVAIIIIGLLLVWASTKVSYSEGYRAGVISKFSEKGYLLKTFEGELNEGAQGDVGNMSQKIWAFSLPSNNQELIQKINDSMSGKRVQLKYEQKYMKYFWLGDTEYYITEIKVDE